MKAQYCNAVGANNKLIIYNNGITYFTKSDLNQNFICSTASIDILSLKKQDKKFV